MNTYELSKNLAEAIHGDQELRRYCRANFGRPLRVCLDYVGEVEDALPYAVVYAESESTSEPGESGANIAVHLAIDGQRDKEGDYIDTMQPIQVNGVWQGGRGAALVGLVEHIKRVLRVAAIGAVRRETRVEYDGLAALPTQWATVTGEYYTPHTFGDTW